MATFYTKCHLDSRVIRFTYAGGGPPVVRGYGAVQSFASIPILLRQRRSVDCFSCPSGWIGKTTGRSAMKGKYWCSRCQVRRRFGRSHFGVGSKGVVDARSFKHPEYGDLAAERSNREARHPHRRAPSGDQEGFIQGSPGSVARDTQGGVSAIEVPRGTRAPGGPTTARPSLRPARRPRTRSRRTRR